MSRDSSSFWDSIKIDNRDNHIEKQALANYERNLQSNNDKPSAGGRERADDEQHVRSDYKPGTENTTNNNDGKTNGNSGNENNGNNGTVGNGNNGSGGGSKNDDDLETAIVDDVNEDLSNDDINEVDEPDGTEDCVEDTGDGDGEDGGMSM